MTRNRATVLRTAEILVFLMEHPAPETAGFIADAVGMQVRSARLVLNQLAEARIVRREVSSDSYAVSEAFRLLAKRTGRSIRSNWREILSYL